MENNIYDFDLTGEVAEKAVKELKKYYEDVKFDDYSGLEKSTHVGLLIWLGIWEMSQEEFNEQLIEVNNLYITVSQFLENLRSNDYARDEDYEYIYNRQENCYVICDGDMERMFVVRNL